VGLASSLARDRRIALLGSGSPMKSGPSPAMPAILAVEPDPEVVEALRLDLPQAGYAPLVARTGEAALALMQRTPPDLLLFDLSLGSSGGEELWARLRAPAYRAIPAILIATREDLDLVGAFHPRPDDFVRKPLSIRELVLRIRAVLARSSSEPEEVLRHQVGPIRIEPGKRQVVLPRGPVALTALELRLLATFMSRIGRIQTRRALLRDVWQVEARHETRTVDTHVRRLREKLGHWRDSIRTVHGVGYLMVDPGELE